jgi:hypothetical protein
VLECPALYQGLFLLPALQFALALQGKQPIVVDIRIDKIVLNLIEIEFLSVADIAEPSLLLFLVQNEGRVAIAKKAQLWQHQLGLLHVVCQAEGLHQPQVVAGAGL